MADNDEVKPDAPVASARSHELLRGTRGDETRIYALRVVAGGAELWRITEIPGAPRQSVKETDLTDADDAAAFLDEIRRSLIAGGWQL